MNKNILSYSSTSEILRIEETSNPLFVDQIGILKSTGQTPEVLFITTFPPRECGIATYSQDLVTALTNQFLKTFTCSICALESETEQHHYNQVPKYILNTDSRNSFIKTAFYINKDSSVELVVIQHEFGFFAKKEEEFNRFLSVITKPVIISFHTVLPSPGDDLKKNVQSISASASCIIVMTENAASILLSDYDIPAHKIRVIAHGTHLVAPLDRAAAKIKYQLSNRMVLSTFGLLGRSKNIECTLEALPAVVKAHPEVLFLVLGKTHPSLMKQDGERYRTLLETKVIELNLSNNVRFVNEYLPLPTLLEYLQLSDIYIFNSKDPNQAVSGTFSYAVSSGCPVISTPIPHAKEVLNSNNGIIIDFENAGQLSVAILSLLDNEKLRLELSSNSIHKMASTVWQNSAIAHALLFEELAMNAFKLNFSSPPINLDHIQKMTTKFGMIQFAKLSIPDIQSGYTLDDNARALIAICQHYELSADPNDIRLIEIYLKFIRYCLQPNGQFLNYANEDRYFTSQNSNENLDDSTGRAIWALGYIVSLKINLPAKLSAEAEDMLKTVLPNLQKIHSTRAMAFILKGLYYQNKKENTYLIKLFADRMIQMYRHERSNDWCWFENYLTYGNSLLSEAILCAYIRTKNPVYRDVAKESFDFLLSKIFIKGKIKVISNRGWHFKDIPLEKTNGGEQPIDVAYTILALEKFYHNFKIEEYRRKASVAFNWFLGENHLEQIVYNPCTGGCYDGVETTNVNLNQGAESTVSYLMARLAIERLESDKSLSNITIAKMTTLRLTNHLEGISSDANITF